jgi:hypothetical protein
MTMEDIATLRMVARWADEAVKAYEVGDERHVVRCYALMFGAIATATGKPAELFKRGLDKDQRDRH